MTYVHNEIHSVIKKKDEILLFVTTGWPGGDKSGGKRLYDFITAWFTEKQRDREKPNRNKP